MTGTSIFPNTILCRGQIEGCLDDYYFFKEFLLLYGVLCCLRPGLSDQCGSSAVEFPVFGSFL